MLSFPGVQNRFCAFFATAFAMVVVMFSSDTPSAAQTTTLCKKIVYADVVALEQAYEINRFSAFVPAGMLYALKDDVVRIDDEKPLGPGNAKLRPGKRPRPIVLRVNEGDCLQVKFTNLLAETTVEANEDLISRNHNGFQDARVSVDMPRTREASFHIAGLELAPMAEVECPIGFACGGDGSNVGTQNLKFHPATPLATRGNYKFGSLASPGQTVVTRWIAGRDGAYFAYSMGAPIGGEGDGGQIGLGLFGAVNVEPAGSRWYRSQVTHDELRCAAGYSLKDNCTGADGEESITRHPYAQINYERQFNNGLRSDMPLLNLLDDGNNIVHSDLNAIIVPPEKSVEACKARAFGNNCGKPFREFTVIFHDEVHAKQAFNELEDENNPLSLLKDGMGINYGVSSMGSLLMSTPAFKKDIYPAKNCPECRAEEFFLSSWANGDPALILNYDDAGKPIGARYPDDPSNVHHSYLGDNVRFRNIHAGPKETHVFHLHAHQWVPDSADPNSSYLDSQTISPGATFSYDIEFGGSGNRNYTPGDSIFHCHLYPHFAQGMWELWRSHDAFTDGQKGLWSPENPRNQNLPDPEIATGTETPALVPIPNAALAPMPSAEFPGYPHYIPGKTGHRPPQPVLDFDIDTGKVTSLLNEPDSKYIRDGGLPRHVLKDNGKTGADAIKSIVETVRDPDVAIAAKVKAHAIEKGGVAAQVIAERVSTQSSISVEALAGEWKTAELEMLNWSGTPSEDRAMKFHEGRLEKLDVPLKDGRLQPVDVNPGEGPSPDLWNPKAYWTDFASAVAQQTQHTSDPLFYVNGAARAQGAPYANPCPTEAPVRDYRAAFIQTELTYNKHGWFDPQGRIAILENDIKDIIDADSRTKLPAPLFFRANSGECINFKSSNFVPSALNADDFQLYTPTDTIGQHIHLVKFDVTSSDGSGNGFNYEDATFSPEEVIERIFAYNRTIPFAQKEKRLLPKEHPLFQIGGDIYEAAHDAQGNELPPSSDANKAAVALWHKGLCPNNAVILTDDQQAIDNYQDSIRKEHPYCGAQRTTQRWWADPILNTVNGHDNTLRTVFTHDHMGPSSHQQHGLYAGLVIEPANSVWTKIGPVADSGKTGSDLEILQQLISNVAACSNTSASPPAWCKSLIGGSDLNQRSSDAVLNSKLLSSIAPRPPLKLRDDGGPTNTMANIYAPECIGDSDSNPLQPQTIRSKLNNPGVRTPCPLEKLTHDTRREFALAIADFGIAYNTLLEPINPEPLGDSTIRDTSFIRFGQRHVMDTPARPLAISSEDPGSQYFNYRHEPLALRISDATPDKKRSGWNYKQSNRRAILDVACKAGDTDCVVRSTEMKCTPGQENCVKPVTCNYGRGDQDCLGDTANGFSTGFHARRDERLLTDPLISLANGEKLSDYTSGATRQMTSPAKLDDVLAKVEQWRVNFNCALYAEELTGNLKAPDGQSLCSKKLERAEPWRQFGDPATPILPAYEGDRAQIRLIQGAQEAQHIFTMNGVKWHRLPGDGNAGEGNNSGYTNAQPVGISEHFEFDIVATPLDNKLTDYMYFGSSTDQIWDGLWGVMRVFSPPQADRAAEEQNVSLITSSSVASASPGQVNFKPKSFLSELPGRIPSQLGSDRTDPCATRYSEQTQNLPHRFFEVSAVRVCDLYGTCKSSRQTGVTYNSRFGIVDDGAIAFVLNRNPAICYNGGDKATDCGQLKQNWDTTPNIKALSDLRAEFGTGKVTDRKLEPLVLRAAAGQCINVHLRNLITPMLPDGPAVDAKGNIMPPAESESYYNFLPMITDGFNINDFQMSSSVGLSPTRVAMHVTNADGSNVGLNGAVASQDGDIEEPAYAETSKIIKYKRQGSLISPCVTGGSDNTCKIDYMWSATDFEGVGGAFNRPLELGAIPLRSFGDPMKHAGHGLIGALVVGPAGSKVCEDDRYFAERKKVNPHAYREGVSAEICKSDGSRYVDHVLIVQDSIFAKHGGFPIPNLAGAEEPDDYGVKGINYKSNPLWARTSNDPSMGFSERNDQDMRAMMKDEPEGLVFTAKSGEEVRLNIVHSGGHTRQQGMAVSGHAWNPYPWSANSHVLNANAGSSIRQGIYNGFGPMMAITLPLQAGGLGGVPMDYLIRSQASFLFDGGIWAVLRVEK